MIGTSLAPLVYSFKICRSCGMTRPLHSFGKKERRPKSVMVYGCKSCVNQKARAYRAANAEKEKARRKARYAANAEKEKAANKARYAANREKIKQKKKAYRAANREKVKQGNRAYRAANREKIKQDNRAYRAANREKRNENQARRRARKRGSKIGPVLTLEVLKRRQGGRCANCKRKGKTVKFHRDHIYPLKTGGPHTADNVQALCAECNGRKGAKDPSVFAREEGRLL